MPLGSLLGAISFGAKIIKTLRGRKKPASQPVQQPVQQAQAFPTFSQVNQSQPPPYRQPNYRPTGASYTGPGGVTVPIYGPRTPSEGGRPPLMAKTTSTPGARRDDDCPCPTDITTALIAGGSSRQSRRAAIELALANGALCGVALEPIIYEATDGSGRRRFGAHKGNVIVRYMNGGVEEVVQMPKAIARSLGLWRAKRKPIVSVRDSNAIRRSNSAKKRLMEAAKDSGLYCATNRPKTTTRRAS